MDINGFDALYRNYCDLVDDCLHEVMGPDYGALYAYEYAGYGYCLLHMLSDFFARDSMAGVYRSAILHLIKQLQHHYDCEFFEFCSSKNGADAFAYKMEIDYGA